MFNEVALEFELPIPTKDLEKNGLFHQRSFLATRLLKYLLHIKSTQKHGYFLTVTSLKFIGKGKTDELYSGHTLFPAKTTCSTFTPCGGETMLGVVHWLHESGALLRCGLVRKIFLSNRKMADYCNFVPGKKAAFVNDSLSRREVGVVVLFRVFAVKWVEKGFRTRREFQVLASLEGDSLGPVSLSGSDELDSL